MGLSARRVTVRVRCASKVVQTLALAQGTGLHCQFFFHGTWLLFLFCVVNLDMERRGVP